MLDLALADQVLHRSGHVFDGHGGVDAVLVEEIDGVGLEPFQRCLGDLFNVLRAAVQPRLFAGVGIEFEPELGGDRHLLAERSQRLAHQFLVEKGAVNFRRIEKRDAEFDGFADHRNHFLLVFGRAVAEAHSHAAEPDGGNFESAFAKLALLHSLSLSLQGRVERRKTVSRSFRFFACLSGNVATRTNHRGWC
jgi:hypothetical protein